MTWQDLYDQIPPERRNEKVRVFDMDTGMIVQGDMKVTTKLELMSELADERIETLRTLFDEEPILVLEN